MPAPNPEPAARSADGPGTAPAGDAGTAPDAGDAGTPPTDGGETLRRSPGPEGGRRNARPAPTPLGPDSLTWRYFGDWRLMLVSLWAGSMQNMHPGLGAGVEQHSEFFRERWQRLLRSLYPINGVVFDGDRAPVTASEVRGYHVGVKGVDAAGRRYSALDPDTFYWAHATFFMSIVTADRYLFRNRLADADLRRLYQESVDWYRLYGMSMRPVPDDWEAFKRYWDRTCTEVLEVNRATLDVLDLRGLPKPPALRHLPEAVWRLVRVPAGAFMVWATVGMYHPAVRARLGYRWSSFDERALRAVGTAVDATWGRLPLRWRTHPRALAGMHRARGSAPADAPLPQAPERLLPPPGSRHDPKHYCPR